jgi:hypothetical protein
LGRICIWTNPLKKFENERGWESGSTSLRAFFLHDDTIGCKHVKVAQNINFQMKKTKKKNFVGLNLCDNF